MIKTFSVTGLNGDQNHSLKFNPDLNIITGRNGCGKTSLLKLLWYMFSGNIERTRPEIEFRKAKLVGDNYWVSIDLYSGDNKDISLIKWKIPKQRQRQMSFPREQWNNGTMTTVR